MNTTPDALDFDRQIDQSRQDNLLVQIDKGLKRIDEFLDLVKRDDEIVVELNKLQQTLADQIEFIENFAKAGVSDCATIHSRFIKGQLNSSHFAVLNDEFESVLSDVNVLKEALIKYEELFAELVISSLRKQELSVPT